MKKFPFFASIFIALLMFIFIKCDSSTEVKELNYTTSTIDVSSNYSFPEGTYYKYQFKSYNEELFRS